MKIAYVITGLGMGGAEAALYKLLGATHEPDHEAVVITLTDRGHYGSKIEAIGIPVYALGIKGFLSATIGIKTLVRLLRTIEPDIVQTWMYHADFVGGVAARIAGIKNVIWNVRHSRLKLASTKITTWLIALLCVPASRFIPKVIITCSYSSRDWHRRLGYDSSKLCVISNGFNTKAYKPDASARKRIREEIQCGNEKFVIGIVARYHLDKDYENFLKAMRFVANSQPDIRLLLCGPGVDESNEELLRLIRRYQLNRNISMLGSRMDMPAIFASLDLLVLSSISEGSPNVIGEAMSCGVPVVSTDVGDAAKIVGNSDMIVPASEPEMLATAVCRVMELSSVSYRDLSKDCRLRAVSKLSLDHMASRYLEVYDNLKLSPCFENR